MIGVIADAADRDVVLEFFELFKTPWEFYRETQDYDVLLCADENPGGLAGAKLTLVYSSRKLAADERSPIDIVHPQLGARVLSYGEDRIPIYGNFIGFRGEFASLLTKEESGECVGYLKRTNDTSFIRIGYDLFSEIRSLLTVGQPPENAGIPATELHISFLRDMIVACGVSMVEIPPVPDGYQLIACLTHDVDHPSIRKHKWDHTAAGFLLRAVLGSVLRLFRGRLSAWNVLRNWFAAAKWPLVHFGIARDFWNDFDDRYLKLEAGVPSTFFVIPRSGYAGRRAEGSAPSMRASAYAAKDLESTIQRLLAAGCEIGLHGIDAWIDSSAGSDELNEVRGLCGKSEIGVRMHWLYYNGQTPALLEKAGASYDSTFGYNETTGYRAGTAQAYKPLGAERLLELPLHAMDTALFYPSYLALSPSKAAARLHQLTDDVVRHGGCLTINWHDRSLSPERLWERTYQDLIEYLIERGAWIATAQQVVAWFRKRRSTTFDPGHAEGLLVHSEISSGPERALPGLQLRIRKDESQVKSVRRSANGAEAEAHSLFEGSPLFDVKRLAI